MINTVDFGLTLFIFLCLGIGEIKTYVEPLISYDSGSDQHHTMEIMKRKSIQTKLIGENQNEIESTQISFDVHSESNKEECDGNDVYDKSEDEKVGSLAISLVDVM